MRGRKRGLITKPLAKRELARRARALADLPKLLDGNFKSQEDFINDPARLKAALCTRRAGKSYGCALYLVKEALEHPGTNQLYIALTRESAKNILWKDCLKRIDRKHSLGIRFNETALTATFPNGSVIKLTGVDVSEREMEKLLGQFYKLVIIDESASYTIDLRYLVYVVLKPAVTDLAGTICMIGTPGNITKSLFHDVCDLKEAGWSVHSWGARDNPYMRKAWERELEEIRTTRPLYMETAQFKQHYLGLWVVDDTKKVYAFNKDRNLFKVLPEYPRGSWVYNMGVDLGFNDATAFTIACYHEHDPTLYIVSSYKKSGMDITDVANAIKRAKKRYDINKVIVDGANKQAVEEMRRRHDLHMIAADKTGKEDFIALMNAEFVQGRIKIDHANCVPYVEELDALIWDEKGDKRREHPNCENHLCFVAGTIVETKTGPKPIETIKPGDLVLTRKGFFPVMRSGLTGERETVTLEFSNGSLVCCTPDHPIWTEENGFVRADALLYSQRCVSIDSWRNRNYLCSMEENIEDTQNPKEALIGLISKIAVEGPCTETYGFITTEQFLKDGTFTTKTGIPLTTALKTLSVSQGPNTINYTKKKIPEDPVCKIIWSFLIKSDLLLRFGMGVKKGLDGIANMPKMFSEIYKKTKLKLNALFVKTSTLEQDATNQKLNIAQTNAGLKQDDYQDLITLKNNVLGAKTLLSQTNTQKEKHAVWFVRSTTGSKKQKVYNLEVGSVHEYFANGILVSNCDASYYLWRHSYQYYSKKPKEAPKIGTPEWNREQEEQMFHLLHDKLIEQEEFLSDINLMYA